ncbi:hypothetical protein [Niveispirillum irakense]|uniref:hypothetical protein n=1 Tax=Niveispirillum irakense TaxID=34011 RepID=UPI000429418C|nr:hypothetical protein [Niveispirillum irakense]
MMDNQYQLLTTPLSDPASIAAAYIELTVEEGQPAGLGFTLAVPQGWVYLPQGGQAPDQTTPVQPLALFRPAVEGAMGQAAGAELVVWCALLVREIHAADWLRVWAASQHLDVLEMREVPSAQGQVGDMLAGSATSNGPRKLHRMMALRNGPWLYLLDYRFQAGDPTLVQARQEPALLAVRHFRPLVPAHNLDAEPMGEPVLAGVAPVIFRLPTSWRVVASPDYPAGGSALILTAARGDGAPSGLMLAVRGAPGADAAALENISIAKLVNNGYEIAAESRPAPPIGIATVTQRDAGRQGAALTLLAARGQIDAAPFSLILLSPPPDASLEAWAINRRAFEIAVTSLRPVPLDP